MTLLSFLDEYENLALLAKDAVCPSDALESFLEISKHPNKLAVIHVGYLAASRASEKSKGPSAVRSLPQIRGRIQGR